MQRFKDIWLTILFFGIFFEGISFGVWRKYQINHFPYYIIAVTTRKVITAKNGPEIEFTYQAKGKDYKGYGYDVETFHIRYTTGFTGN